MGGLIGVYGRHGFSENEFTEAVDLLSHRGSDEKCVEVSSDYLIGFNRLVTSKSQTQPYSGVNKDILIIIDGEIYNIKELMLDLELGVEGGSVDTNRIIAGIYHKYGVDGFKLFNGMFLIYIHDYKNKKIYLVKDKLGLKPLFYSLSDNNIIFSSEAKAIFALRGNATIDYSSSLNMIFLAGRPPFGNTIFKDVNDLEQSHYLLIDTSEFNVSIHRYFDISSWISEDIYRENSLLKNSEIEDKFYQAFKSATTRQLDTDANVGFLFSAGLDSSMISALSADHLDKMNLYYYESEMHDYSKYTDLFKKRFDANLIQLKTDDFKFILDLPFMVYHFESTGKEEGPPIANLSKIASENGDKVLLTGDGDTILGGSGVHASFYARSVFGNNRITLIFSKLLNKIFPGLFQSGITPETIDYLFFPSGYNFPEVLTNILLFGGGRLKGWKDRIAGYSFINDKTERETQAFILDDTMYRFQRYMIRQERTSSRYSNQFRYPYLDDEIIKLSVNMPLHLKQKLNFSQFGDRFGMFVEGKSICRKVALRAGVPKEIVYRREVGSPFNSIGYMRTIIQHWELMNLSRHLSINEDVLKYVALESYDIEIPRVHYAFIVTEILLRLFQNNQSPEEISDQFNWLLNKHHKRG